MHVQFACAATALATLAFGAFFDPANRLRRQQQRHPASPTAAAGDSSTSSNGSITASRVEALAAPQARVPVPAAAGAAVVSANVPGDALPAVSSMCLLVYCGVLLYTMSEG